MSVVKCDPFKYIATLQGRINRLFEDAFPRSAMEGEDLSTCAWRPLVDIFESDDGVVVQMDLPGVQKDDVTIEVKNNVLNVHGLRAAKSDVREDRFYRRERTCGTFQRAFSLHTAIAPETIKATFKHGVLTILIPHPEEDKPKKISVSID
ncbi:MAG: Hsp20/alpha crystallin family protein [Desulfatitalea sp.]|nr:Hsp20/alpha crystallin family protein [Desulfatitalea sp.]